MSTCEFGGCEAPADTEVFDDDEETGVLMLCRAHASQRSVGEAPVGFVVRQPSPCCAVSGIGEIRSGDTGPIICDRLEGHTGPHEGHDPDASGPWNAHNARRSWGEL